MFTSIAAQGCREESGMIKKRLPPGPYAIPAAEQQHVKNLPSKRSAGREATVEGVLLGSQWRPRIKKLHVSAVMGNRDNINIGTIVRSSIHARIPCSTIENTLPCISFDVIVEYLFEEFQ